MLRIFFSPSMKSTRRRIRESLPWNSLRGWNVGVPQREKPSKKVSPRGITISARSAVGRPFKGTNRFKHVHGNILQQRTIIRFKLETRIRNRIYYAVHMEASTFQWTRTECVASHVTI